MIYFKLHKTTYDTDKSDLEKTISDADKKIPETSDLAKKTDLNAKITEIESKIPSITGLATNSTLTTVENKIPDVSSLVQKTDYNTQISEIENNVNDHDHEKYITTPEFNVLAARVFNASIYLTAIVSIKGNDYRIHFWYMSKDDAISIMNNSNLNLKNGIL